LYQKLKPEVAVLTGVLKSGIEHVIYSRCSFFNPLGDLKPWSYRLFEGFEQLDV
jgi:hypothetical protein